MQYAATTEPGAVRWAWGAAVPADRHPIDASNNSWAALRVRDRRGSDLTYVETFDAWADWDMRRTPMARP